MAHQNLYDELSSYIDGDERIVFPDTYLENRELYNDVRDIVYLIKTDGYDENGVLVEKQIDWVPEKCLGRVLKERNCEVMSKHLIVRLRLPWERLSYEWLIDQDELDEFRDHYDILDVFLKVKAKDEESDAMVQFNKAEFERHRDNYEVIEARYLVAPKLTTIQKARYLGIDPDSVHTYMSE